MIAPGFDWLACCSTVSSRTVIRCASSNGIRTEYISSMAHAAIFRNCSISSHIVPLRNQLAQKRDVIVRALDDYLQDKISFSNPNGGIYIWGKLNEPINEKQLIIQSLKQEVAFMPGSIFGAKDGYIRLSYGKVNINQIEEGISRLREAILVCEK